MAEALPVHGDFEQRLEKFPNLFLLDFIHRRPKDRYVKELKEKEELRERRLQEGEEIDDDHVSSLDSRIIVFMRWMAGHRRSAEEMALQDVDERPYDLVAGTSLAFILHKQEKEDLAYEQLRRLEGLKRDDPEQFARMELEAEPLIRHLYINICYDTEPYEMSDRMEDMLAKRPDDDDIMFDLASLMRCYTQRAYMELHPNADFTRAIRRAIQLFAAIKDGKAINRKKGLAAAKLGSIIAWNPDERLREAADRESRRLHLDARRCFEEALALSPDVHTVCQLAGKYFRRSDVHRSKKLLERAVSLRPGATNHHQLGLTYRQMARFPQGRRGSVPFRSGDPNVTKAMEHFRKAVQISGGNNNYAQIDLDEMQRALSGRR